MSASRLIRSCCTPCWRNSTSTELTHAPGPTTLSAVSASPAPGSGDGSVLPAVLPALAGLNLRAGLRHAGGKAALYVQLLQLFAHDYVDFSTTLEAMLAAENWNDATRQAHTLKGLCATLGADEVHPLAAALEKALQARDRVTARRFLASTGNAVAALGAALRSHFACGDADKPAADRTGAWNAAQLGPDATAAGFSDWLPRLRDLLQQGDNDARELWKSSQAEIQAQLPFHVVQRIAIALANYEFDSALRLLPDPPEKVG